MYQVRRNSQTSSEIKESASFQAAAIEIDNFLSEGNTRRADSRVRQLLMEILRTYREETGQRYIEEMKNRWGFLFDIEQFVRSSRYLLQREREERQRLVEGERLLRNFAFPPVAVEQPTGVAARVFNTYKILLVVAKLIGDEEFPMQIQDRLLLETAELKEAQSVEPDGLVLRALIEAISTPAGFHFRNVKIGILTQSIFNNHRVSLQPHQVGEIARQLGFETKNSHGVRVVVPTPVTLLKACDECGYEDEAITELKKQITRPERG